MVETMDEERVERIPGESVCQFDRLLINPINYKPSSSKRPVLRIAILWC